MQTIDQAYDEIRRLVEQITGAPAPEVGPQAFVPFPAGCDPVSYAMQEVEQLRRMAGQDSTDSPRTPRWCPRADVFSGESGMCFRFEIPGVTHDDLTVTVAAGELTVRGQRHPPASGDDLRPFFVEQPWGAFERRFPLPPWCDPKGIEARYADGVLDVTVKRLQESGGAERTIKIG